METKNLTATTSSFIEAFDDTLQEFQIPEVIRDMMRTCMIDKFKSRLMSNLSTEKERLQLDRDYKLKLKELDRKKEILN